MKKQVLFIHGGGEGAYEADGKLVASLQAKLGTEYDVRYPPMPNEHSPEYEAWKRQIAKETTASMILAGHSLGASFLLKYLAEELIEEPLAGIFLIAAPFWGATDWEVDEYTLAEGFAAQLPQVPFFLYHSRDDDIVPFAHLAMYVQRLPQATIREFNGRGHQLNNDLSEVALDILAL